MFKHVSTGITELDEVLGGGVVQGKTILLGGPKGIGKSTLLLQACDGYAREGRKSAFVSGEMTKDDLRVWTKRLKIENSDLYIHADPDGVGVEDIFDLVEETGASFLAIDSLQTVSVNEVKAPFGSPKLTAAAMNVISARSQKNDCATFTVCHLNKKGDWAGPSTIQHLADGLLCLDYPIQYVRYDSPIPYVSYDSGIRQLNWDGKSRQCDASLTSLLELTPEGFRTPSKAALRLLHRLRGHERFDG